ncbi:MAG: hypothetical protein IJU64_05660 [Bacilli bacterium]|nr:hypothetical protein [Bacilli bacterium]
MSEEINPYRAEYDANEANTNRQMVIADAFSGGILAIVWIPYLTHVFLVLRKRF